MANDITTNASRNSLALQSKPSGFSVAPTNFAEVVDFAKDMCRAETAIPKHLRGNPGACMAVALQAFEWNLSPFAVANKSYSVNDRIAYEAQLIAAVVNTRSGIQGRLKYKYEGEGAKLRCTVTGILDGEECSYRSPLFADITPKNSPLWKSDPEQQLGYYSARAWARRHVPEVILGVYDREEAEVMEAVDVTPPSPKIERQEPTKSGHASDYIPAEGKIKDAEVVKDEPAEEQQEGTGQKFGDFETLGDYMSGLEIALDRCASEEEVEEIFSEFDPMATLEGDDDSQDLANKIKLRVLKKLQPPKASKAKAELKDDQPEVQSDGKLFSDD